MKYLAFALMMGVFAFTTGCNNEGRPGGPGANLPESEQATIGQTDNSFSLDAPVTATDVTQGETDEVTIGIERGDNFAQDVTLTFDNLPAGVTLTPANATLAQGDSEVKFTLSAAPDAAVGDHILVVTGRPAQGATATTELKISVNPK
jgi:uncharacterized membrane protein